MTGKPNPCSIQDGCDAPDICIKEGACHYTGTALDQSMNPPHFNNQYEVFPGVNRMDDVILPSKTPEFDSMGSLRTGKPFTLTDSFAEHVTAAVDKILERRRAAVTSEERVMSVMRGILGMTYTELTDFADTVYRRCSGTTTHQALAEALTGSAEYKLSKYELEHLPKTEKKPT